MRATPATLDPDFETIDDDGFDALTVDACRARAIAHTPALLLVAALTIDSLRMACGSVAASPESVAAERDWIASRSEAPFSFEWCCIALGIDADAIRSRLAAGWHVARERPGRNNPRRRKSESPRLHR